MLKCFIVTQGSSHHQVSLGTEFLIDICSKQGSVLYPLHLVDGLQKLLLLKKVIPVKTGLRRNLDLAVYKKKDIPSVNDVLQVHLSSSQCLLSGKSLGRCMLNLDDRSGINRY